MADNGLVMDEKVPRRARYLDADRPRVFGPGGMFNTPIGTDRSRPFVVIRRYAETPSPTPDGVDRHPRRGRQDAVLAQGTGQARGHRLGTS